MRIQKFADPTKLNDYVPVNLDAKQTTEVFIKDNKLKLQVKRKGFSAQELIESSNKR